MGALTSLSIMGIQEEMRAFLMLKAVWVDKISRI